jgi:shikimate kinase
MNIILIGFMGCGKTSLGLRLAKKLGYQFCDTDQMIEKELGRSISDIFETEGEEYFRLLETATIEKLIGILDNSVLSVGGGLPIRQGNGDLLKKLGHVIYLKTSKEIIIKRLAGDKTRPLLAGDNKDEKITNLFKLREPIYEKVSNYIVTTDNRTFEDLMSDIILVVNKH